MFFVNVFDEHLPCLCLLSIQQKSRHNFVNRSARLIEAGYVQALAIVFCSGWPFLQDKPSNMVVLQTVLLTVIKYNFQHRFFEPSTASVRDSLNNLIVGAETPPNCLYTNGPKIESALPLNFLSFVVLFAWQPSTGLA